jgi:hypothetical protein
LLLINNLARNGVAYNSRQELKNLKRQIAYLSGNSFKKVTIKKRNILSFMIGDHRRKVQSLVQSLIGVGRCGS